MIQFKSLFWKPLPYLFLLITVVLSGALRAQTVGNASINADTKAITLAADEALNFHYAMDISQAGFSSAPEAEAYFADIATKLVSFTVDTATNKVEVYLNVRLQPNWDVTAWNEYLASLVQQE